MSEAGRGIQAVTAIEFRQELRDILVPFLGKELAGRQSGHCMKMTDLDVDLMIDLTKALQASGVGAQVYVLGTKESADGTVIITSTKLVELRNPLADGSQRPPLLVFVPAELRTSAEDSFGTATFQDVSVVEIYPLLLRTLLDRIPQGIRTLVETVFLSIDQRSSPWAVADVVARCRYVKTLLVNKASPELVGASLYELGLVPDFRLHEDQASIPTRLTRNLHVVDVLTNEPGSERARVLSPRLELESGELTGRLMSYAVGRGLSDPRIWTRGIALEREHWGLTFDQWVFTTGLSKPHICIQVTNLEIPKVPDLVDRKDLQELAGQQVLAAGSTTAKFSVTFTTDQSPTNIPGFDKFVIELVSLVDGSVVKTKSKGSTKHRKATVLFKDIHRYGLSEGYYRLRVRALGTDGEPLFLVDEHGSLLPPPSRDPTAPRAINESESFYVIEGEAPELPPIQKKIPVTPSFEHARMDCAFSMVRAKREPVAVNLSGATWEVDGKHGQKLILDLGDQGIRQASASHDLHIVESNILADPCALNQWQIQIAQNGAHAPSSSPSPVSIKEIPFGDEFVAARTAFATAVRGSEKQVCQGFDYRKNAPLIEAYATSYLRCIEGLLKQVSETGSTAQARALTALRHLTALDSVTIAAEVGPGRAHEAILLAPTHPLRAAWWSLWAHVVDRWTSAAFRAKPEFLGQTQEALGLMAPINLPSVLPSPNGRLFVAVDNIHPFWSLYASPAEDDVRGLTGSVCSVLGLPEPGIGGAVINGSYLADRVRRYISHHPYVRTLVINAFQPGRGGVLSEMLLELQRKTPSVHFDIRLFVADPDAPGLGDSLAELLDPDATLTAKEADAFASPSRHACFPKLAVSVRGINEFLANPSGFRAHLSMLFDVFQPEAVGTVVANDGFAGGWVHGLIPQQVTRYEDDEAGIRWRRYHRSGPVSQLPEAEGLTQIFSVLPGIMEQAAAVLASGQVVPGLRPAITLSLDSRGRALLHHLHEVSDWVVTIDRHLGIEFFDHGGSVDKNERPDYLIDHSPDLRSVFSHRVVITSRSLTELESMLRPVLEERNLPHDLVAAKIVLGELRALSGRIALKLISAPTQRSEALGLALSRLFLESQGVFSNQIVVPLDAHLDLFQGVFRDAAGGSEITLKRTDLALFDLNMASREITCNLVEVKCYSNAGDDEAFGKLRDHIAEQLRMSELALQWHFNPQQNTEDRADRLMKTREFAALLEFYLDRSIRHGLVSEDAASEAKLFIETLEQDDGYRLHFTRTGLIFDFAQTGSVTTEKELGVQYHRIGHDIARGLLQDAIQRFAPVTTSSGTDPETVSTHAIAVAAVPKITDADFVAKERDRTETLDRLRKRGQTSDRLVPTSTPETPMVVEPESAPELVVAITPPLPKPTRSLETAPPNEASAQRIPPSGATPSHFIPPSIPNQSSAKVSSGQASDSVRADILLGVTGTSPQAGVLGDLSGKNVVLDLNQTHTISLFGVQGGGKSYTLGTIIEMASMAIPGISLLPAPLATVVFHYSKTQDYQPEFASMRAANDDADQLKILAERYGARPQALSDVVLLAPADKVEVRRQEFPGVEVHPLVFSASELQAAHWMFLMGAVGNQSLYLKQITQLMRQCRNDLTLSGLRSAIQSSAMTDNLQATALSRLDLAAQYITDRATPFSSLIRPGRLVIVDLRDEFISKDEALGLFVVMLQLVSEAKITDKTFNKLVVFDEAHKYIESPELVSGLIEVVREMRHKGTSILVASQDPPSVPVSLIELSSCIVMHRFNSPQWLKHIQRANAALNGLTPEQMAALRSGEAYVWSGKATDDRFSRGAIKLKCRPRVTRHGGATKTAVEG